MERFEEAGAEEWTWAVVIWIDDSMREILDMALQLFNVRQMSRWYLLCAVLWEVVRGDEACCRRKMVG